MTTSNSQEGKKQNIQPRHFNFKLAIGIAAVCVAVGLLLPVVKYEIGFHHRMPAGQFKADMRTMVAGVRYLLSPEPDFQASPANFNNHTITLEKSAAQKI
jgi:hypothetical protein